MTKREDIDQLRNDYSMLLRRIDAIEKRVFDMVSSTDEVSVQDLVQKAWAGANNSLAPKIKDMTKKPFIGAAEC